MGARATAMGERKLTGSKEIPAPKIAAPVPKRAEDGRGQRGERGGREDEQGEAARERRDEGDTRRAGGVDARVKTPSCPLRRRFPRRKGCR